MLPGILSQSPWEGRDDNAGIETPLPLPASDDEYVPATCNILGDFRLEISDADFFTIL